MTPHVALPAERREIGAYFGLLMLALGLADPLGIVNLPILYLLKDEFGLRPPAVAAFEAITLLPVYFGFLCGVLRDRWRPAGFGDRAYFLLSAPLAVTGYIWLAATPASYGVLLIGILLITVAFQFMDTVTEALVTVVAQRHSMTGRLSAFTEFADVVPGILAMLAGGWLAAHAGLGTTFSIAAALTATIVLHALWRPRTIFDRPDALSGATAEPRAAISSLWRHRPLLLTVAILMLWNFSPGWGIPFLYFASETIGLSSEAFGLCQAVNLACIAASTLGYGLLCQRQPLGRTLRWGIVLNIFPGALFLVISDTFQAVIVSAVLGAVFGIANVALYDLLRRACPQKMEGSGTMLGFSALTLAGTIGELFGSVLYEHGGFVACLAIEALATACILPLLLRLPKALLDTCDGGDHMPAPSSLPGAG